MRHAIAVLLLAWVLFLPVRARAQTGSLQITCESGVRVYIDHQFVGVTNDTDNGLFIDALAPGTHRLKAVKTGSEPVVTHVNIVDGQAVEVQVEFPDTGEAAAEPGGAKEEAVKEAPPPAHRHKPKPQPKPNVGTFLLSSDPVGAKVYIDGDYKGDADIVVADSAAGRHTIVFRLGKQHLSGTYSLSAQEVLKLKANFLYEDIINLTEKERRLRTNRPLPSK